MKKIITRKRLTKFLSYYKPYRGIFAMDMFFACVSAVSVLLFPLVSGYITQEVLARQTPGTQKRLIGAGIVLLALLAVQVTANVIYAYFGHAMGAKMESAMREELFAHYQKQSFRFHAANPPGKLMTVMSNDLTGMTEVFHHGPEDLLMTLIKFVGAFVILVNINAPLTGIVFCVLPVLTFYALRADRALEQDTLAAKQELAAMNECLEDALSGIRTVKAFGNEKQEAEYFSRKSRSYTDSRCRFYRTEAFFYEVVGGYPQFLTMLTVFFGALFVGNGTLDIPVLITFLLYVGSLAEPVRILLNFMKLYEEGKAGFIRFMDMLEQEPEIREASHPVTLARGKGDISFRHVSFAYEKGGDQVLRDVNLEIPGGKSTAIVGVSGIGKTTASLLIARFYDVTEGSVCIDGTDVRQIAQESLRETVGIVQQEVFIFNGTIEENIRFGKPTATRQEIREAARLANADGFIEKLAHGYDTLVGTHGITLSGGQRQRISLARVFLKNPSILILDEATSALDYESETAVQAALARLMKNRTSVIIAHRLSTIQKVDQIVVLADGGVCEKGTHEELLKKGGEYSRLYALGQ